MKRSDFLKKIGLAAGAIAALPLLPKVITPVGFPNPNMASLRALKTWEHKMEMERTFLYGIRWTPAQTKILEARRKNFTSSS